LTIADLGESAYRHGSRPLGGGMDIHKPKPWRGLREFLKEIGTIVIGVLIALGAEQTVEWLHWQKDVGEAREALREEIRTNAYIAAVRAEEGRCYPDRLNEMLSWAKGGPPLDTSFGGNARFAGPVSTVWEITKAGQTVARMPLKERLAFAQFYDRVANQQTVIQIERNYVVRLVRFLGQPSLTPDQRQHLLEDVAEDRTWFQVGRNNNLGLLAQAKTMGVTPAPFSPRDQARLAAFCRTTPAQAK
jgi:hypothetical protein